jgi:hypothetical protein
VGLYLLLLFAVYAIAAVAVARSPAFAAATSYVSTHPVILERFGAAPAVPWHPEHYRFEENGTLTLIFDVESGAEVATAFVLVSPAGEVTKAFATADGRLLPLPKPGEGKTTEAPVRFPE